MLAMPTAMFGDLMRVSGNESSVYNSSHAPRLQRRICSENTRSMCLIDIMSLSRVLFESLIYEGRPTTVFYPAYAREVKRIMQISRGFILYRVRQKKSNPLTCFAN